MEKNVIVKLFSETKGTVTLFVVSIDGLNRYFTSRSAAKEYYDNYENQSIKIELFESKVVKVNEVKVN